MAVSQLPTLPCPSPSVFAWELSPDGWPGTGAQRALALLSSSLQSPGPGHPWLPHRIEGWEVASQSAGPSPSPCAQEARSEHFSAQAQGPQTLVRKGLSLQGESLAVRQPPNRKGSCELLGRPQLPSPAPMVGVKGPRTEVEKPLGFS